MRNTWTPQTLDSERKLAPKTNPPRFLPSALVRAVVVQHFALARRPGPGSCQGPCMVQTLAGGRYRGVKCACTDQESIAFQEKAQRPLNRIYGILVQDQHAPKMTSARVQGCSIQNNLFPYPGDQSYSFQQQQCVESISEVPHCQFVETFPCRTPQGIAFLFLSSPNASSLGERRFTQPLYPEMLSSLECHGGHLCDLRWGLV